MTDEFIQYCRATLTEKEISAVSEVIRSGWLTTGPNVAAFENEFKTYIGAKHAIALNSCTGGLHTSLAALGIGPGDEVITTPLTFVATGHVIHWLGARPVFVDIDADSYNMDPNRVEAAITPKTKAILPVHFAGLPCNMPALMDIARQHNLAVVEDAAHAVGCEWGGKKIGRFGDATAFSFYPTKNMTTGEGGMVVTDDDELAGRIRKYAFFGIDREVWERYGKKQSWQYDIILPGFKYNLSDVLAAIGRVQLKELESFNRQRDEIARRFKSRLSDLEDRITLPPEHPEAKHNWHLFPIVLDKTEKTREALIEFMQSRKVGSSVHFIPLHFFSFYQKTFGMKKGDYPVTEQVFENIVSIPLYPSLGDGAQDRIVDTVREFFDH